MGWGEVEIVDLVDEEVVEQVIMFATALEMVGGLSMLMGRGWSGLDRERDGADQDAPFGGNWWSHFKSSAAWEAAINSGSALERAWVACFLLRQ